MLQPLIVLFFLVQFSGNHATVHEWMESGGLNLKRKVEENSSNSVSSERMSKHDGRVSDRTAFERRLANYTLLKQVFSALNSTLNYYSKYSKEMNLDAFAGVRIAEGQIQVLLSHFPPKVDAKVEREVRRSIQELRDTAKTVANKAASTLEVQYPDYYHHMVTLTEEGFWEIYYESRELTESSTEGKDYYFEESMEKKSDMCMAELFGTRSSNKPCSISDECWKTMASIGGKGYYITHKALYIIIGKKAGCKKEMDRRAKEDGKGTLDFRLNFYCSSIRKEAIKFLRHNIKGLYRDIFIEEGMVCGILGFRNFFRYDWLQLVLSWQSSTGCYKEVAPMDKLDNRGRRIELDLHFLFPALRSKLKRLLPDQETLHMEYQFRKKPKDILSRVRRNEKLMTGHCSAHTTAVAAGNLALYIRYILEAIARQASA